MHIEGEAKLLRIFVGESDLINHIPVYEKIVLEARKAGLAGATVTKGNNGFWRFKAQNPYFKTIKAF